MEQPIEVFNEYLLREKKIKEGIKLERIPSQELNIIYSNVFIMWNILAVRLLKEEDDVIRVVKKIESYWKKILMYFVNYL